MIDTRIDNFYPLKIVVISVVGVEHCASNIWDLWKSKLGKYHLQEKGFHTYWPA